VLWGRICGGRRVEGIINGKKRKREKRKKKISKSQKDRKYPETEEELLFSIL
jgi:hypothetical protein